MADRGVHACGFTLMELLAVLAVLAIVVTMGVPSFAGLVRTARELNAYHLLTASLATARMAAVQRGSPVTVCPTRDGASCRDDLIWDDGWIIYIDPDRRSTPRGPADILRHISGTGPGISLRSTQGRPRVRFTPNGWSSGSNVSIYLCSNATQQLLGSVVVNNAGRARSERSSPDDPCPYAIDA